MSGPYATIPNRINTCVHLRPHCYPHFYSDEYCTDVKPDTFCCVLEDANGEGGGE